MDGITNKQDGVVVKGELSSLLEDVMRMAIHAVETGNLSEQISLAELYRIWDVKFGDKQKISQEDITYLEYCYRNLEKDLSPVTAVSLKATEIIDSTDNRNYSNTQTGKRLKSMWITSFLTLAIILIINLFIQSFELMSGNWASAHSLEVFELTTILYIISPIALTFAYGAFGASVRLLRVTQTKMKERTYDPRAISEEQHRFVLGTLSGGLFVFLYKAYIIETGGNFFFSEAILGFIAGYSIDLLFTLIDRIVSMLHSAITSTKEKPIIESKEKSVPMPIKPKAVREAEIELHSDDIKSNVTSSVSKIV